MKDNISEQELDKMMEAADDESDEEVEEEERPTEQDIQNANALLRDPRLLYTVACTMDRLGIAGEKRSGLLLYLVLTSRLLAHPLSVISKGASGSGKSYLVQNMLRMFPGNGYVDITYATPKSFYHSPAGRFRRKIIVVFEKHGAENADYAIRTFQSEGFLKIQVTERDGKGNWTTNEKKVEGPVGFVTTTTKAYVHPENETRLLSLYADDGYQQTIAVLDMAASKYEGGLAITETELRTFQVAQRLLKVKPVVIPFARVLCEYFPSDIVRVRRDYHQLLSVIEASALLHQEQRERQVLNGVEHVVANLCDYHIAQVLVGNVLRSTIFEIPPKTERLIEIGRKLKKPFDVHLLARKAGWEYDVTLKWFNQGKDKGCFTLVQVGGGPRGTSYKVSLSKLNQVKKHTLPPVQILIDTHPGVYKGEAIYDPIGGEVLRLEN
ncbi:MAG: hypothetical protein HY978_03300 [Candidatus Liptonbacteria bacterium]|nr:hypothetical protein [Candidatus Liptonbacteria bacterium]